MRTVAGSSPSLHRRGALDGARCSSLAAQGPLGLRPTLAPFASTPAFPGLRKDRRVVSITPRDGCVRSARGPATPGAKHNRVDSRLSVACRRVPGRRSGALARGHPRDTAEVAGSGGRTVSNTSSILARAARLRDVERLRSEEWRVSLRTRQGRPRRPEPRRRGARRRRSERGSCRVGQTPLGHRAPSDRRRATNEDPEGPTPSAASRTASRRFGRHTMEYFRKRRSCGTMPGENHDARCASPVAVSASGRALRPAHRA